MKEETKHCHQFVNCIHHTDTYGTLRAYSVTHENVFLLLTVKLSCVVENMLNCDTIIRRYFSTIVIITNKLIKYLNTCTSNQIT